MIRRALRRVDTFFFTLWDPLPAACLRVGVGALMLASLLMNSPHWYRNYHPEGMPGLSDPSLFPGSARWYSFLRWTPDWIPIGVFCWLAVLLSVGYLVGFHSKKCALGLLVILSGLFFENYWTTNAEDTMFRMYMFYSLFLPVGDRMSFDRWRAGELPRRDRTIWPARMVQFHLLLIYLISTPTKWVADASWREGEALYYVMVNPMWSRWPWPEMFYLEWVAGAATYGSLLFEGLFPFLVWAPRWRAPLVVSMMCFHLLMAAVLNHITFFSLTMIPGLVLFLKADELEDAWRSISTRFSSGRKKLERESPTRAGSL